LHRWKCQREPTHHDNSEDVGVLPGPRGGELRLDGLRYRGFLLGLHELNLHGLRRLLSGRSEAPAPGLHGGDGEGAARGGESGEGQRFGGEEAEGQRRGGHGRGGEGRHGVEWPSEEEEGGDNIVDSRGQRTIRLKANGSDQPG